MARQPHYNNRNNSNNRNPNHNNQNNQFNIAMINNMQSMQNNGMQNMIGNPNLNNINNQNFNSNNYALQMLAQQQMQNQQMNGQNNNQMIHQINLNGQNLQGIQNLSNRMPAPNNNNFNQNRNNQAVNNQQAQLQAMQAKLQHQAQQQNNANLLKNMQQNQQLNNQMQQNNNGLNLNQQMNNAGNFNQNMANKQHGLSNVIHNVAHIANQNKEIDSLTEQVRAQNNPGQNNQNQNQSNMIAAQAMAQLNKQQLIIHLSQQQQQQQNNMMNNLQNQNQNLNNLQGNPFINNQNNQQLNFAQSQQQQLQLLTKQAQLIQAAQNQQQQQQQQQQNNNNQNQNFINNNLQQNINPNSNDNNDRNISRNNENKPDAMQNIAQTRDEINNMTNNMTNKQHEQLQQALQLSQAGSQFPQLFGLNSNFNSINANHLKNPNFNANLTMATNLMNNQLRPAFTNLMHQQQAANMPIFANGQQIAVTSTGNIPINVQQQQQLVHARSTSNSFSQPGPNLVGSLNTPSQSGSHNPNNNTNSVNTTNGNVVTADQKPILAHSQKILNQKIDETSTHNKQHLSNSVNQPEGDNKTDNERSIAETKDSEDGKKSVPLNSQASKTGSLTGTATPFNPNAASVFYPKNPTSTSESTSAIKRREKNVIQIKNPETGQQKIINKTTVPGFNPITKFNPPPKSETDETNGETATAKPAAPTLKAREKKPLFTFKKKTESVSDNKTEENKSAEAKPETATPAPEKAATEEKEPAPVVENKGGKLQPEPVKSPAPSKKNVTNPGDNKENIKVPANNGQTPPATQKSVGDNNKTGKKEPEVQTQPSKTSQKQDKKSEDKKPEPKKSNKPSESKKDTKLSPSNQKSNRKDSESSVASSTRPESQKSRKNSEKQANSNSASSSKTGKSPREQSPKMSEKPGKKEPVGKSNLVKENTKPNNQKSSSSDKKIEKSPSKSNANKQTSSKTPVEKSPEVKHKAGKLQEVETKKISESEPAKLTMDLPEKDTQAKDSKTTENQVDVNNNPTTTTTNDQTTTADKTTANQDSSKNTDSTASVDQKTVQVAEAPKDVSKPEEPKTDKLSTQTTKKDTASNSVATSGKSTPVSGTTASPTFENKETKAEQPKETTASSASNITTAAEPSTQRKRLNLKAKGTTDLGTNPFSKKINFSSNPFGGPRKVGGASSNAESGNESGNSTPARSLTQPFSKPSLKPAAKTTTPEPQTGGLLGSKPATTEEKTDLTTNLLDGPPIASDNTAALNPNAPPGIIKLTPNAPKGPSKSQSVQLPPPTKNTPQSQTSVGAFPRRGSGPVQQYSRDLLLQYQPSKQCLATPPNWNPGNLPTVMHDKPVADVGTIIDEMNKKRGSICLGGDANRFPTVMKQNSKRGPHHQNSNQHQQKVITLTRNVKTPQLETSENAMKFRKKGEKTLEQNIRADLNRITAENYQNIMEKIKKYDIPNDPEKYKNIVSIIFEKAIDEQHFSGIYAELCLDLTNHNKKQIEEEIRRADKSLVGKQMTEIRQKLRARNIELETPDFRGEILRSCQQMFEKFSFEVGENGKPKFDDLLNSDERIKENKAKKQEFVEAKEKHDKEMEKFKEEERKKKRFNNTDGAGYTDEELAKKLDKNEKWKKFNEDLKKIESDIRNWDDEVQERVNKLKNRRFGNVKFIGELFKRGLLIEQIMHNCCIQPLLKEPDDDKIKALKALLLLAGPKIDANPKQAAMRKYPTEEARKRALKSINDKAKQVERYFEDIADIIKNYEKMGLSKQSWSFLCDLQDLRRDGWQNQRIGTTQGGGPKTINQVRDDIKQKELKELEMNQQNNDYGGGYGGYGGKNQSGYGGKNQSGRNMDKGNKGVAKRENVYQSSRLDSILNPGKSGSTDRRSRQSRNAGKGGSTENKNPREIKLSRKIIPDNGVADVINLISESKMVRAVQDKVLKKRL